MTESLENLKIREFKIDELFWILHVSMYTDKTEVYVYQVAIIEDKHKRFVTPVQKTQLKDVLTFESKQDSGSQSIILRKICSRLTQEHSSGRT